MDFRNQVGIDIFGSEIGSDLENRGPAAQHPYQGFPGVPRGWWLAKLDCDLFFFTLSCIVQRNSSSMTMMKIQKKRSLRIPVTKRNLILVQIKKMMIASKLQRQVGYPFLKRIKPLGTKVNLVLDLLTKFVYIQLYFFWLNMKKKCSNYQF